MRMKKKFATILIICLTILSLLFGVLWQKAENNKDDIRELAQASASDAFSQFVEYQTTGEMSSYWHGVAAFRSFEQAYYLLVDGTSKSSNYAFCNEVYGYLVLSPEASQKHMAEIIEVMEILSMNVENEDGYLRMADLRNNIQE